MGYLTMKSKNRLVLWTRVIADEIVSEILLIILIVSLTISVTFSYVTVTRYKRYKTAGELFKIRECYFYKLSLDEGFMSNEKEHIKMINKINSLDSVERAVGVNTNSYYMTIFNEPYKGNGKDAFPKEDDAIGVIGVTFVSSDYSNNNIFPIVTTDNRIIREMNYDQIVLDESAQSVYSVGDKIWVDGVYVDFDKQLIEPRYAQVEIIGFVSKNQLIINSGSNTGDLKAFYATFHDFEGEAEVEDNLPLYFGLATGFAGNHEVFFSSINDPQMLIIFKNGDYSESEMIEQMKGIISNPTAVTPYKYYEEVYEKDYYTEIKLSIIYMFMSIVLVFVSLIVFLKRWYDTRKEELITYYILGTTWRESVLMSLSPYFFSLFLGSLLGALIWNKYSLETDDYLNMVKPTFYICLFLAYVVLYICCALPYYLMNMRNNPIEIYKCKGE